MRGNLLKSQPNFHFMMINSDSTLSEGYGLLAGKFARRVRSLLGEHARSVWSGPPFTETLRIMSPPLSCRNLQVVAHTFAVTKLVASHLRCSRSYALTYLCRSNRRDKLFPAVTSKSFQNCHRMTIGANFELLCFRSLKLIAAKSSAKLLEPQWTLTKLKVRVNGQRQTSSRTCMRPRVLPKFDHKDAEAWPGTPKTLNFQELIHRKV